MNLISGFVFIGPTNQKRGIELCLHRKVVGRSSRIFGGYCFELSNPEKKFTMGNQNHSTFL